MNKILRTLYFALVIRPVVNLFLGLHVRGREKLPDSGPAIIAANHNSHLDTMVLMSLLPLKQLHEIRPVAAVDYFLKNKLLAWFAQQIVGIIPIHRRARSIDGQHPLDPCFQALDNGNILIIFPEGSRGQPEKLSNFKNGIAHLAERFPTAPVIPVFMHGLGKALPKGEALLVPFICDVFIGEPFSWRGDRKEFLMELDNAMEGLAKERSFPAWD